MTDMDIVMAGLSRAENLAMLAEECCELGQAALKLRRTLAADAMPAPVTYEEAEAQVMEEIADVLLCVDQELTGRGLSAIDEIMTRKRDRMARRIEARDAARCRICEREATPQAPDGGLVGGEVGEERACADCAVADEAPTPRMLSIGEVLQGEACWLETDARRAQVYPAVRLGEVTVVYDDGTRETRRGVDYLRHWRCWDRDPQALGAAIPWGTPQM